MKAEVKTFKINNPEDAIEYKKVAYVPYTAYEHTNDGMKMSEN